MKNFISIGMPVHNGQEHIAKAIKSILTQSYRQFELIISDDASTDRTAAICKKYALTDDRIKYYRQKNNIGFLKNFNFVLRKARGKYFMWAGQDDFWNNAFIYELHRLLEKHEDSVLAMSNFENVYNLTHYKNIPLKINNDNTVFASLATFINSGELSLFYGLHRTSNLKKIGGYQSSSRPFFKSSDYMTIFKSLILGKLVYTHKILFYKRDTGLHFAKFDLLKDLNLSKEVRKKITRFIFFPILFIYDLLTSVRFIMVSSFRLDEKIKLIFLIFRLYVKNNLRFIYNNLLGIKSLFIGVFKRLSNT